MEVKVVSRKLVKPRTPTLENLKNYKISFMDELNPTMNVVWVTDWSKFGFYEADFGRGKPVWASVANVVVKNHVPLMAAKEGDGIEAWVQLENSCMPYFHKEINKLLSS